LHIIYVITVSIRITTNYVRISSNQLFTFNILPHTECELNMDTTFGLFITVLAIHQPLTFSFKT